ncbi:CHAT domain-containing protein [Suillus subalutaceus]|uniref:CHAT domain-containing protein n=1 Tax=Suillus subalutaceus TaxID=48586 RepID=UPI001B85D7B7|nr:CHAT domain-containing protein [Suillus subalutaceus]KAG1842271.1 CHAT domain-containing protein [Suillus subalutaceus]
MDVLALRTDAGHRLLTWYHRTQNSRDLDQSIKHFGSALDICPTDHPCHTAALFNLATAKFVSCQADGRHLDLDIPINLFQDALDLRPADHPDRSITQLHLAIALLSRFMKRGFQAEAYTAQEDEPRVLDEVISFHYDALGYYNSGHACRGQLLGNLAVMLETRFERRGNEEDLDQAIALQRDGLALCPVGHTDWSWSLNNLANGLSFRFQHRGNDEDLDQAIALHMEALALRPVDHTNRSISLNNLATQISSRFKHRGNDKDLDQAIALHREALALRPVGHTDWSLSLSNLADQLCSQFEHRGNNEDFDEAIALHREVLALCPVGHTDRSSSLRSLADGLSLRFQHRGNNKDLDQAIALHMEALALRDTFPHNTQYSRVRALHAFLRLSALCRTASRSIHPLSNQSLGMSLFGRAETHLYWLSTFLICACQVVIPTPVGHTDRSHSLNSLAAQLSSHFEHRGNDRDLDQAIALHREALALRPVGHTNRSQSLNNLAIQLSYHFEHRGNDEDLDQAIALHREALALCPVGHTDQFKSLNNLATPLSIHFEHRGNDADLDQAIALQREAMALRPVGHIGRSISLNNLANQLFFCFHHQGNDGDLDEVIALNRDVLDLRPVSHTDRSASLNNLANQLSSRFKHQHNREDLDQSQDNLRCALTLLTQHDPRQLKVHESLAKVYLSFHHSGLDGTGAGEDAESLNAALHHLKAAANVVSAGLLLRLRASLRWVRHARQNSHGTELEAYASSMQLLDAYMSTTASVSSRHNIMKDFPNTLAVDAASCALRSGDVCHAVELLEQGRTIIWTQMTRLRTPLDDLQIHGDHAAALMKKFRDLSSLLDKPPANYPEATSRVDVEAEETQYRRLVKDWNGAVEEIRKIEGYSRFLLPPLFSGLQDAARDGPIIVLIASESSCDAIIIMHKQPPTSIRLPTNHVKLQTLVVTLQEAIDQEAGPKGNQPALTKALRELWGNVVRPVVENLGGFAPRGSRIWWCPTSFFNFLLLHAAGEYRVNGESLPQQYISSYTPSLTALMKARRRHDRCPSVPFAAIGQNLPDGASFTLDGVEPELELVRSLLPPSPEVSFTKITSVDATKSRALRALRDNTWLHLSCHGTQKFDEPFNSAFLMCDQPLSLLDITQMDLSRHQFAFLSACETAVGVPATPDEVIHLAAGLQFAGVKSVVGTLWKVNDNTVQCLVEAFYKDLCGDGKMNSKRAARALHQAVHSLARNKDMPLDQRIVFMHIGV